MGVCCSHVMQSAPSLGPMMAVTLAICLSYIHLEPFRHRTTVREYARECHRSLAHNMGGRRGNSTNWNKICRLAEESYENDIASAQVVEAQQNFPRSWPEKVYSHVFMKARDRFVATVGAFLSPVLLIYWTGYLLEYFGAIWSCHVMEILLLLTYCLLTTVIILIILAASLGPRIVDGVKRQIDGYEYEIRALAGPELQEKAQKSKL